MPAINQCQHVLIYLPVWGGYSIVCRHCGTAYGFSDSPDLKLLAGFNRNHRRTAPKRAPRRKAAQ